MRRATPRVRIAIVLVAAISLTGCAARVTQGEAPGVKWRVGELVTSERAATMPGYKNDGKAKDYRYVVVLEDTRGVGVNFRSVESLTISGPGFRATPRSSPLQARLPPNGQMRIRMSDSVWLVVPQWFEGAARPVNLDAVARKIFVGVDDRGAPVRLEVEFPLENIPAR